MKAMQLNYSRSPELYLNFLRTNFNELPKANAVPVSSEASPDSLAVFLREKKLFPLRSISYGAGEKRVISFPS